MGSQNQVSWGVVMKKIKKYLLFLLLVPMCFGFVACKKNKSNSDAPSVDNSSPNDEITTPTTSYYSVLFDYNLPEDYSYLLGTLKIDNKQTGTTTKLANVSITKLIPYFKGWSYKGSSEILSTGVTSDTAKTIELVGNWDIDNLEKYYYSDGLEFTSNDENGTAAVSSYSGGSSTVIIPKVFVSGGTEYEVKKISVDAFYNTNATIKKVVLKAEDIEVGLRAFMGTKIISFNFENVASIGDYAFNNTKIQEVKLNSEISAVGNSAFADCKNLTKVDFNHAEIDISEYAFSGDGKLKTIENAENLKDFGASSFASCGLEKVDFIGNNTQIIHENAFSGCVNLTSAEIPESVGSVYSAIFGGCSKLETLTISNLYCGDSNNFFNFTVRFGDLSSSLKTINLAGTTIKNLPQHYFQGLTSLEKLAMCNSITTVGEYAFKGCSNLNEISFSNGINVASFSIAAIYETKFYNKMKEPFYLNSVLFYVPASFNQANYVVNDDTTSICQNAFSGNKNLQSITIPSTVNFIGNAAFKNCENLTTVNFELNSSLAAISKELFNGCRNLANINFENLTALTTIGDHAFEGVALTSFAISSTMTSIGNRVFYASKIAEFTGGSSKYIVEDGVLYEKNAAGDELTLLCYPSYKTMEMFMFPEKVGGIDVTAVASYAFYNVTALKKLYFKQNSMAWQTYSDANGNVLHNLSFDMQNSFVIFAKQSTFTCNARMASVYYELADTENISFNFETNTITFNDGFQSDKKKVYFITGNTEDGKYYLIYFEIEKTTGDDGDVYSVKKDSLVKIEAPEEMRDINN